MPVLILLCFCAVKGILGRTTANKKYIDGKDVTSLVAKIRRRIERLRGELSVDVLAASELRVELTLRFSHPQLCFFGLPQQVLQAFNLVTLGSLLTPSRNASLLVAIVPASTLLNRAEERLNQARLCFLSLFCLDIFLSFSVCLIFSSALSLL